MKWDEPIDNWEEQEEQRQAAAARAAIEQFVNDSYGAFPWIWRWGDGDGGWLLGSIQDAARMRGLIP